jgi:hypothetical protein
LQNQYIVHKSVKSVDDIFAYAVHDLPDVVKTQMHPSRVVFVEGKEVVYRKVGGERDYEFYCVQFSSLHRLIATITVVLLA